MFSEPITFRKFTVNTTKRQARKTGKYPEGMIHLTVGR